MQGIFVIENRPQAVYPREKPKYKGLRMAKNKKFLKFLKGKGIKKKALAERLGISVRAVEHWLNGRNRPSIIYLIEMSKLFKMSIESVYDMFRERN